MHPIKPDETQVFIQANPKLDSFVVLKHKLGRRRLFQSYAAPRVRRAHVGLILCLPGHMTEGQHGLERAIAGVDDQLLVLDLDPQAAVPRIPVVARVRCQGHLLWLLIFHGAVLWRGTVLRWLGIGGCLAVCYWPDDAVNELLFENVGHVGGLDRAAEQHKAKLQARHKEEAAAEAGHAAAMADDGMATVVDDHQPGAVEVRRGQRVDGRRCGIRQRADLGQPLVHRLGDGPLLMQERPDELKVVGGAGDDGAGALRLVALHGRELAVPLLGLVPRVPRGRAVAETALPAARRLQRRRGHVEGREEARVEKVGKGHAGLGLDEVRGDGVHDVVVHVAAADGRADLQVAQVASDGASIIRLLCVDAKI